MVQIRWARSARKHRIGRTHALQVITMTAPEVITATEDRDVHWSWVGVDDRGVELEIEAALPADEDILLVIHVMPTALRRNR